MISNVGVSWVFPFKDDNKFLFLQKDLERKAKGENWTWKLINTCSQKDHDIRRMILMEDDYINQSQVWLEKKEGGFKKISSSKGSLKCLLNYFNQKKSYEFFLKGSVFEFNDFRIFLSRIIKNNIQTVNCILIIEAKFMKSICFEVSHYKTLGKEFLGYFANSLLNIVNSDKSWECMSKYRQIFDDESCLSFNESVRNLILLNILS